MELERRKFGRHNDELTVLGLGTWAFGGSGWAGSWGEQDDDTSIATIHAALDLGINWIDTAQVYGLGHSETVVGRALRGRRDDVFLATKCVERFDGTDLFMSGNPASVRQDLERSLLRLKTDRVDLLQVHGQFDDVPYEVCWSAFADLVDDGLVRYIGVSNLTVEQTRRCHLEHRVDSVQPELNLLTEAEAEPLVEFARENEIAVLAYSPLASGLLTDSFDLERLGPDDWRRGPDFVERINRSEDVLPVVRDVASEHGLAPATVALAALTGRPDVTSAIVGSRDPSQITAIIEGHHRANAAALREEVRRGRLGAAQNGGG